MVKKITDSFRITGIQEFKVEVEHGYPWVSIHLPPLNCNDMMSVSEWIMETFSEVGMYSHLSPTIGMRNGSFCLVIDKVQCEKVFGGLT
jgi:hypothetical protein